MHINWPQFLLFQNNFAALGPENVFCSA